MKKMLVIVLAAMMILSGCGAQNSSVPASESETGTAQPSTFDTPDESFGGAADPLDEAFSVSPNPEF